MPASNLSPEALQAFSKLQQELRSFLKEFAAIPSGSASYQQYAPEAAKIKKAYVALGKLPLSASKSGQEGMSEKEKKKQKRKERRAARKESRKEECAKRREKREARKVERKKQKNDKSGAKEESQFRFDELKAMWDEFQFDKITSDFRKYLDKGEEFLTKAENFISFVESFAPNQFDNEIDEVKQLIDKIKKFLAVARNVSNQVDQYAKIAKDVIDITLSLPSKVEDIKDGVIVEANKVFAAARNFIAIADPEDKGITDKVEKLKDYLKQGQDKLGQLESLVGLATADEDGDNLPDWYNKLEAKYNELFQNKDLIPGTTIDDKILVQITGLKKSVDRFIAAASDKVEALGLQEKLNNAKQWLGKLGEFTSAITGFVDNLKEGDLATIYQDLKTFKNFLDSDEDILQGTNVDDKIKGKLQEYSKKAQQWLMSKLTGGDPAKEAEVKGILSQIDKLILSTGGVVDHSSKYEKDKDKISMPEINDVNSQEMAAVMKKYGIRKKDASFEGILSDMKDQSDGMKDKAADRFRAAAARGAQASAAFRDAKEEYDQAVKKHEDYFKATNFFGKKVIQGLLSVAGVALDSFAPGAGRVVTAVGSALLGEFDAVNNEIDRIIPSGFEFIGDLAKDALPGILPKWGSERGLIQIEGKELLKGLNELYANGIAARYQEVIKLLNDMRAKTSALGKNLRSLEQADQVDQAALDAVKKRVVILEMKWAGLKDDILKKYVNLSYPPINQKKAYRFASRYLYSVWLIRFPQKEIRIGKAMIKQFDKFGILKEAKAEWDTGFFAGLGRGFFGFFGADPFDYRKELKKMKIWASQENDRLKTPQAWANVF